MYDPWVLGGDFNAALYTTERRSNAKHGISIDRDFCRWFEESCISDLGFVGPCFTWKRSNSEARLDHFLANDAWCQLFPNARVSHLSFYKFDHRPILLQLDHCAESPCRPFRFIAAWVLHEDFNSFVLDNWNDGIGWSNNLNHFQQPIALGISRYLGTLKVEKRNC
ncbi:uncharacterized protein LOC114729277 [Neltuma alba]|uniref:uncharacterized protein LOC114729277 n=1 Tax=Neltuma alba TaxID=207710 RepID=UPI0010A56C83|nr:uncharacterized protein LOC114729277 [Prosopis alba]